MNNETAPLSLVSFFIAGALRGGPDTPAYGRYVVYPPKDYQEKLKKLHGEKVKIIVVKEGG